MSLKFKISNFKLSVLSLKFNNFFFKVSLINLQSSLAFFLLLFLFQVQAQEIKKSKKVETIEGRTYYMHTVDKGQTLYAISHAYELKVNDVIIENPDAIDGIKPGQTLKIPIKKETPKIEIFTKSDSVKYTFHLVQQGETLYGLSKFYKLTVDKLKELNPELKEGLKIGQRLKIPKANSIIKNPYENSLSHAEANPKKANAILDEVQAVNDTVIPETKLSETKTILKVDTSTKKNNFNIALLLPFQLTEALEVDVDKIVNDELQFPINSEIAIQFYQGAKMALDSLKRVGISAKLFVYDIGENDTLKILQILKRSELLTMDLIIGPLYSTDFVPFSKFAKQHQISIISPVSQQNKILFNNPFVSKATSSVATQTEQMARFVVANNKAQNIIVVNSGNPKDINLVKIFITQANKELRSMGADSVKEVRGFGGIESALVESKVNVIVVPSNNKTFVTDFITKLNPLVDKKKQIILYGMQSWSEFDNLDIDYLNKMNTHYPTSSFIDYDNISVKEFVKSYAERYKTDPGPFVFQGYDVFNFYLTMLSSYGLNLQNKLAETKQQGLQTSFEFYQVSPESGFENKAVYMLMYQDYKLLKAN